MSNRYRIDNHLTAVTPTVTVNCIPSAEHLYCSFALTGRPFISSDAILDLINGTNYSFILLYFIYHIFIHDHFKSHQITLKTSSIVSLTSKTIEITLKRCIVHENIIIIGDNMEILKYGGHLGYRYSSLLERLSTQKLLREV